MEGPGAAAPDPDPDDLPTVHPAWDPDEPWIVLDEGEGEGEGESHYAVTVPAAIREELMDRLRTGAARLSREVEVEVTDHAGHRSVWDNDLVRTKVDAGSQECLRALREGAALDDAALTALAAAAGLLSSLWQLADRIDPGDGPTTTAEPDDESAEDGGWVDALDKLCADCEAMILGRIRRRRDGTFAMRWQPHDREVVAEAIKEVSALISSEDSTTARLFPTAYPEDAERNAGWDALARRELVERRLEALASVEELLERKRCTADELGVFMRCLNDARLVLAARLEVDEHGPSVELAMADRRSYAAYEHITYLLAQVIRALQSTV